MLEFFCQHTRLFNTLWMALLFFRMYLNRELFRWHGYAEYQDIRDTTPGSDDTLLSQIFTFKWVPEGDDDQKILNYKKTANITSIVFIIYTVFMFAKWVILYGDC